MKILYLDTTTSYLYTGIVVDNKLIAEVKEDFGKDLSSVTLKKISEMLETNNLKPNDIDKIIVVNGPGSFTGIRVGITIAKTYAYSLNKEIINITSLEAMAVSSQENTFKIPIIDARRGYVYGAIFNQNNSIVLKPQYIKLDALKCATDNLIDDFIKQWENIQDIAIQNVDRVPFGFIKSPIDNRDSNDDYGVPITYGCDKIIEEIKECLEQIKDEFELKEAKVFADERLFDKDNKTGKLSVKEKLFITLRGMSEQKQIETYSPDIRESSHYNRLTKLFELLEKEVGTSRGILTTPDATYENKDAVREANRATWSIVSALRKSIEKAFDDVLYACDVYANYYNMSPAGEYTYKFDWDYSLIESSTETFAQMKDLQSIGAMSKAELRAWATGEDLETAQSKIDEIAKNEPDLKTLMGMSE